MRFSPLLQRYSAAFTCYVVLWVQRVSWFSNLRVVFAQGDLTIHSLRTEIWITRCLLYYAVLVFKWTLQLNTPSPMTVTVNHCIRWCTHEWVIWQHNQAYPIHTVIAMLPLHHVKAGFQACPFIMNTPPSCLSLKLVLFGVADIPYKVNRRIHWVCVTDSMQFGLEAVTLPTLAAYREELLFCCFVALSTSLISASLTSMHMQA